MAAKFEDPGQLEDAKDLEDLVEAAALLFLVIPVRGKGCCRKVFRIFFSLIVHIAAWPTVKLVVITGWLI